MARQLRIEYPGAFYHVTSRGNQKKPIVLADRDRCVLLDYFLEAHKKYGAIIHTYCLMDNHYHLLLETPLGNLSKIMHFINTSYTVFFNKKHSLVGHLFQGRYKAILIQTDTYAQELSRYIHLNPVRAEIVAFPEEYLWSSYREYMGQRPPAPWLNTTMVLGYFGHDFRNAGTRYAAFVAEAIGKTVENPLKKARSSLILGSEDFVARIKKAFLSDKPGNREVPAIRALKEKPALETIQRTVERSLGSKNRFARNVAIFLCRNRTDYTLTEIAEFYRISKSAVGKIFQQTKENLAWNKTLEGAVQEIEKSLF
jgi:REP element-mobilizing transposase RayT